jgi:polygalacturonase
MKRLCTTLFLSLFATFAGRAAETNTAVSALIGDGATLNTAAIQQLIDDRSAAGGGTVHFPAGRFVTGTIQLKNNVTLELDAQTVLLGSTNVADYKNVDPFLAGDGVPLGHALIVADGVTNVGVTGAGLIDGRGRELKARQKNFTVRPLLMRWLHCTNVAVKDVHLTNPGAWTLNFFQTRTALVERVTIRTREKRLPNNDGIDLDSCEAVRIRDCDIESGDDALCLKTTSTQPCRDIVASGCKLSTLCNAIKLGTESIGDFENVAITNCEIRDTGMAGIALYDVDGARMHDINIGNLTMSNVTVAVSIRLGARLKTFRTGDQPRPVGVLHDVNIHDVRARRVGQIGLLINGIPGHAIENLAFENLALEVTGGSSATNTLVQLPERESAYPEFSMFGKTMPAYGAYMRHGRNVSFQNVQLTPTHPDARPAIVFDDVSEVKTDKSLK